MKMAPLLFILKLFLTIFIIDIEDQLIYKYGENLFSLILFIKLHG